MGLIEVEDWTEAIGNAVTVFAVLQLMSGIQVCREFVQKGTTGDASGLPFVIGALNCAIWLKYGLYTSNSPLAIVNFVGCCLHTSYTICYYLYTQRSRLQIQKQITFAVTFFITVVVVTDVVAVDVTHVQYILGVIGCTLSVGFFAAPLVSLSHVLRSKSTESLPFAMIVANFVAGALWSLYGILVADNFIKIPNFLGFSLAAFQLGLFGYFPSARAGLPLKAPNLKSKETLLSID